MENNVDEFPQKKGRPVSWMIGIGRTFIGLSCLAKPGILINQLQRSDEQFEVARTLSNLTFGRDLALGLGTCISTWKDNDSRKGWILAGLLADSVDLYSFSRDESFKLVPRVSSGIIAGGAVLMGIWALIE